MSSQNNSKFLQEEEALTPELREIISTLPSEKAWISCVYQYQGFWYPIRTLKGVISSQKHFVVQDSDIFLVTFPKSGTTWLKAIMFTLLNRKRYPIAANNHPLLTHNPHDLVPFLDYDLYANNEIRNFASPPSPRLFSTHRPHGSLPESVKKSSTCKFVYLCRNPKDTFVSLWHFTNKLRLREIGTASMGEDFEMFCKGVSLYGPFWDHVLEYWKQRKEYPGRVFFLKYEDMKEQPALHLRRLAQFLNCPFSAAEEESGLMEHILKLCSFDSMSALDVNKNGKLLLSGVENNTFFRRGEVGDWKNHLSAEMVEKLDQITEERLCGSGLVL